MPRASLSEFPAARRKRTPGTCAAYSRIESSTDSHRVWKTEPDRNACLLWSRAIQSWFVVETPPRLLCPQSKAGEKIVRHGHARDHVYINEALVNQQLTDGVVIIRPMQLEPVG